MEGQPNSSFLEGEPAMLGLRLWLSTPPRDIAEVVRATLGIFQIQLCLMPTQILGFALLRVLKILELKPQRPDLLLDHSFPVVIILLFSSVWLEEVIFRLPLALPAKRYGLGWQTIATAVILSILFGWAHGSLYNIFFQGFDGLLWSLLFLKISAANRQYMRAFLATTALHLTWDLIFTPVVWYGYHLSHGGFYT